MTEPKAIWEGVIVVAGLSLKCFVLDDGRRIIDADSLARFMEWMASDQENKTTDRNDFIEMVKFCRGDGIPQYSMKE